MAEKYEYREEEKIEAVPKPEIILKDCDNYIKLQFLVRKTNEFLSRLFIKQWNLTIKKSKWEDTDINRHDFIFGPGKEFSKSCEPVEQEFIGARKVSEWNTQLLVQALRCLNVKVPDHILKGLESVSNTIRDLELEVTDSDYNTYFIQISVLLGKLNLPYRELDEVKRMKIKSDSLESIPFDAKVLKLRNSGNEAFKNGNFKKARHYYSEAISTPEISCNELAVLYSNRSYASLKLGRISSAKKDALTSIYFCPIWWKGYYRLANVYKADEDYQSALKNLLLSQRFHDTPIKLVEEIDLCKQAISLQKKGKHFDPLHENYDEESSNKAFESLTQAMYAYRGQEVPQDFENAVEWYAKAAAQGSAEAMFFLATMYMNGQGVAPSSSKIIKLLKEAAERPNLIRLNGQITPSVGVVGAQHALGEAYEKGNRVIKNYAKARYWYERAIKNWSGPSAYSMGKMYAEGLGIPKSLDTAINYWKLGAAMGNVKCMERLVDTYLKLEDFVNMQLWYLYAAEYSSKLKSKLKDIEIFKENITQNFKHKAFAKSLWREIENGSLKHLVDKKIKQFYENDCVMRKIFSETQL